MLAHDGEREPRFITIVEAQPAFGPSVREVPGPNLVQRPIPTRTKWLTWSLLSNKPPPVPTDKVPEYRSDSWMETGDSLNHNTAKS